METEVKILRAWHRLPDYTCGEELPDSDWDRLRTGLVSHISSYAHAAYEYNAACLVTTPDKIRVALYVLLDPPPFDKRAMENKGESVINTTVSQLGVYAIEKFDSHQKELNRLNDLLEDALKRIETLGRRIERVNSPAQ